MGAVLRLREARLEDGREDEAEGEHVAQLLHLVRVRVRVRVRGRVGVRVRVRVSSSTSASPLRSILRHTE